MIIKTNLYGEQSHSYGVTVKTRSAPAPRASPASYAYEKGYEKVNIHTVFTSDLCNNKDILRSTYVIISACIHHISFMAPMCQSVCSI